jgi:hypothetical protein
LGELSFAIIHYFRDTYFIRGTLSSSALGIKGEDDKMLTVAGLIKERITKGMQTQVVLESASKWNAEFLLKYYKNDVNKLWKEVGLAMRGGGGSLSVFF